MTTSQLPIFVQYIQALAPSFIATVAALIAGYIAWRQWKTAHDKLRFDIFKIRYEYFLVIRNFLIVIAQSGDAAASEQNEFVRRMVGAEFVFKKDILEFIETVRVRSIRIRSLNSRLQSLENQETRNEIVDETTRLFQSFVDDFSTLEERFRRSLGLSNI